MDLDPHINVVIVIPDGDPKLATPTQGFAVSLIGMSWAIRGTALLPTNVFDLTEEGHKVVLARRMSGTSPVSWYGQSPRAIRSMPHPALLPFTLIVLPSSENPKDYEDWAKASEVRPTIVAEAGGDLNELSLDAVQAQFLKVCDRIPDKISKASVEAARAAIKAWKPMPKRKLDYQVGSHNSITPNLAALAVAGFEDMEVGPFNAPGANVKPYVEQIVKTSNSILDERAKVGERDLQRIFRRPPDLNLFAPSIYPDFFSTPLSLDMDKAMRRKTLLVRQMLERQTGYGFDLTTPAQKAAMIGELVKDEDGQIAIKPNPLMRARASELVLNTDLMCALSASEFSA